MWRVFSVCAWIVRFIFHVLQSHLYLMRECQYITVCSWISGERETETFVVHGCTRAKPCSLCPTVWNGAFDLLVCWLRTKFTCPYLSVAAWILEDFLYCFPLHMDKFWYELYRLCSLLFVAMSLPVHSAFSSFISLFQYVAVLTWLFQIISEVVSGTLLVKKTRWFRAVTSRLKSNYQCHSRDHFFKNAITI